MDRSNTVIYSSDPEVLTPRALTKAMLRGLSDGRLLGWRMFLRDLQAEFAGSFLGYLWNFADPLILAGVFIVLRSGGLISDSMINMPFSLYVLFGMSLLQLFLNAMMAPLRMVSSGRNMLTHVRIPPESVLLAVVFRQLFDAACYIPVLAIVCIGLGAFQLEGFLLFTVLVPSMVLLGLCIGLALAPINEIYNDFSKFLSNLSRPLIFICPTFYRPANSIEWLETLNHWNPIAILMDNLRLLGVQGQWASPTSFCIVVAASIALLLIGWMLFHVSIRIITDPL